MASKRVKWWHVLIAVGSPLAIQAITSFTIYGDPLPNTYYLKMTGYPTVLRLTRGAWETARDILRILPLFALILLTKNRWKWPVLAALATAVWLGGDAWHNDMTASRYVLSVLPLLLVYGALVAVEWIPRKALWPVVAVAVLAFSPFPRLTLIEKANHYQKGDYRTAVAQGLWTSGRKNVTTIGVVAAGIIPYVSRKVSLDILGKSDTIIAKMPMHRAPEGVSPLTYFNPGHLKWDARYTAAVQRPLVVWQIWGDKTRWRAVLESCGYELRIVSSGNDTWPVFVR